MKSLRTKLDGEKNCNVRQCQRGQKLCYFGKTYTVKHIDSLKDDDVDYALFMTNEEVSAKYIPQLVEKKVVCIDNSSAFRMKKDVPLVVPQITCAGYWQMQTCCQSKLHQQFRLQ